MREPPGSRLALVVELLDELRGSDHTVGLLADGRDLAPVDPPVEADPDPATSAHVGWPEEALGLGLHEFPLRPGRSRTPEVRELVLVVAVGPVRDERGLAPDEPRGRPVAEP